MSPETSHRSDISSIRCAPSEATVVHGRAPSIWLAGISKSFPRDVQIYGEKEPADYVYKVISGVVRTYKVLVDGRRQVGAFYLAGDTFGMEAGEEHLFSAEGVKGTRVVLVKRTVFISLAASDNAIARELWAVITEELRRTQNHMLLLARSAPERVANFLLEMAERTGSGDQMELPMPRQDIADYLGLTIETVSRMLTRLEEGLAITLPTSKRVVLRDCGMLMRLNG